MNKMYNLAEKVIDKYKSGKRKLKEVLNEHFYQKIADFFQKDVYDFPEGNEKRASEMSYEECYRSRLAKIKKTHPDLAEKEQEKMAKDRCKDRARADLIVEDINDKRPPKEWWDACYATIQKSNPKYTDEQIRKTCGKIYYQMGVRKKMGDFIEDLDELLPSETVKHPGSAKAWCKSHGLLDEDGDVGDKCIEAMINSKDKSIQTKGKLAKAFKTMRKQKKAKKKKDFYTEDFVNYLGKFYVKDMEDFTTMQGFLTRSGKFEYPDPEYPNDPSKTITKIKKWDGPGGIKPAFQEIRLLPMYGSRWNDSHTERDDRLIGFMHDWKFIEPGVVDEDGHILAKQEYFDDIRKLSDLRNPTDLPMSLAFDDATPESDYQYISQLHHGAVSLNKVERDRCSTAGGMACNSQEIKSTINQAHDSISGLAGSDGTETKPILKIKKKEEKTMTEDFEQIEDADDTNTWGKKLEECMASGKSKEECQIAIRREEKAGKETNAKGGNVKADFEALQKENEELKKKIADMQEVQKNKIQDLIEYVDGLKAKEAKQKEAELETIRKDLIEKGFCEDAVNKGSYDFLKGFNKLFDTNEKFKPKAEKDMITDSDTSLTGFDKRVDELKKNLEWMVIK